jgi:hypothetical protein
MLNTVLSRDTYLFSTDQVDPELPEISNLTVSNGLYFVTLVQNRIIDQMTYFEVMD